MLTLNVYDRVFFVKSSAYGTAFSIDVDGRQYLVSAKHIVNPDGEFKIYYDNKWKQLPVTLVGTGVGEIDVSVLAPKYRLSSNIKLNPAIGDFILGQDAYFVGFPYKMWSEGGDIMQGRPLPFVKKGAISAGMDPTDSIKRIYIDAINNEGFSGGPLVVAKPNTIDYRVIGVVSKFRIEHEPVIDNEDKDTGLKVAYNTGFMIAYSMKHVLDIIHNNPIGLPIENTLLGSDF